MSDDSDRDVPINVDPEIRESERRLIQKELFLLEDQKEEAEQRFRVMFENALVGLFRGRVETRKITDANQEAARIFGVDDVPELLWWVNLDTDAFSFFDDLPDPDQLVPGEPHSFSSRTRRKDGSEFWAQFTVRYTRDGRYLDGAVKDITDQVESLDRLRSAKAGAEEANEAKSRFLAIMSHEIRTPLNGIIGFAEILQELNHPWSREYSRKILDESDRLMILINQLLDFSKLEADKIRLESIILDLPQLLGEIETSFRETIERNGLDLTVNLDSDLPQLFVGDPMRLRQVITNLMSNALKFTREGSISVDVSRVGEVSGIPLVKFSVADTGIGIPENKQEAIFARFEQADTSISRQYGGTGLGIPICRELINLMGGDLFVESREGKGSTFYFTVPMDLPEEVVKPSPAFRGYHLDRIESLTGVKALIVEDYETNREIARHHLERAGCIVFHAENGREALDLIRGGIEADLVFMDVHMPEMDGLETTRRLRSEGFETPVIGMTASAYAEDRIRCLDSGMDDFITKPLRRAVLLAKTVDWVATGRLGAGEDSRSLGGGIPGATMTGASVLRYNDLLDELGGEKDLARELMDGFVTNCRESLDRAGAALEAGDDAVLHREAHSIKGGALNVMADETADSAFTLETAAKGNASVERLREGLDRLEAAYALLSAVWKELRKTNETD